MAQSAGRQISEKRGSHTKSIASHEKNRRAEATNGITHNMTDLDFLRGLIEAVDQSGIDSLEINRAGTRIRISKTPPAAPVASQPAIGSAPSSAPALPESAGNASAAAAPEAVDAATQVKTNLIDVTSPMVGTFYRAPAPDAPPYAEVGTTVNRGQPLCILEAMKLMNELECEIDGVVREILVEDADPVEFGQVLFRIEPSGSK
ncbi:acetyl-CoA carboxylase biotin carboxyl carrier protein [soil metagenome]